MSTALDALRTAIDDLDGRIVELLNQRAALSREIGQLKSVSRDGIFQPDREREVLGHVAGLNSGILPETHLHRIYREILSSSRDLQGDMRKNSEVAAIPAPASKSLSHRALICAALACGTSRLSGVLDSQDIRRTIACLRSLGADITEQGSALCVRGMGQAQPGAGGAGGASPDILTGVDTRCLAIDVGESGTTCRLLLAVAAAIPGVYRFSGQGRMHDRPVADLTTALKDQGAELLFENAPGFLPLRLQSSGLVGGEVSINLEQSSQYLSGLLLAAPLAAARTIIRLTGKSVASWPYVALTVDAMARFGVPVLVERHSAGAWAACSLEQASQCAPEDIRFLVDPLPYQAQDMQVEGDWSNASYFLAAGAAGTCPVRLTGLNPDSVQGDRVMLEILGRMGARVAWTDTATAGAAQAVTVFPSALRGVHVDMSACPDLVPTMAVLAAFATGETIISGAAHLKIKESDRILGPVTELARAGVCIRATGDGMVIQGQSLFRNPTQRPVRAVDFACYGDHRMAMSLSLLELAGIDVRLDNPDCVAKSFPGFWTSWEQIRQGNAVTPDCKTKNLASSMRGAGNASPACQRHASIVVIGAGGRMGARFVQAFRAAGRTVHAFDQPLEQECLSDAVRQSELVLLCVPITAMDEVVAAVAPHLVDRTVLADICSVKVRPLATMLAATRTPVVGTHPLFGPDTQGAELRVAVTPGRNQEAAEHLADLFRDLGFAPFQTTAQEHDQAMACIQGLNFVTSVAYLSACRLDQGMERFFTPSFEQRMGAAAKMLTEDAGMFISMFEANPYSLEAVRLFRSYLNVGAGGDLELLRNNALKLLEKMSGNGA